MVDYSDSSCEIRYKKVTANVEADMLSRNPIFLEVTHLLNANGIIECQKTDELICNKFQ